MSLQTNNQKKNKQTNKVAMARRKGTLPLTLWQAL